MANLKNKSMTTSLTEKQRKDRQTIDVIRVISIGKKFRFTKTQDKNIDKDFQDLWALKNLSLNVQQGQTLGIIGRNGAGKTTLLNIIAGILSPSEGQCFIKGKILGLFNLGVGFQDELTGLENIFLNGAILGASKKELDTKLRSIIDFSELGDFINMPLGSYSQGMRLRLGFSIVANLDFDILVIDEVLAVGDTLFQNKCYERLMDRKRMGKTLVLSSQNMELIERLCDEVVLLDHGQAIFQGNVLEGIDRYYALLNTEKFFVGPSHKNLFLVENTKKWSQDIENWGKKFGTKEAVIESVEFINKFGKRCMQIKSRDPLKIRVNFTVKNTIKEPHFGVAIFRNDGVYCYGPNTAFDGYHIPAIGPGKGWFILNFKELQLASGEYRLSVAIWDKNETLAYDYHNGYYPLIIAGPLKEKRELLNFRYQRDPLNQLYKLLFLIRQNRCSHLNLLPRDCNIPQENEDIKIESVKLLNLLNQEKNVFMTNESVRLKIQSREFKIQTADLYLFIEIFRDDEILCQEFTVPIRMTKDLNIVFPKVPLLPGHYKISIGMGDIKTKNILTYVQDAFVFRMVFNRRDHGTIYLDHSWHWQVGGQ